MNKHILILYVLVALLFLLIPVGLFVGHAAIRGVTEGIIQICDQRYVAKQ